MTKPVCLITGVGDGTGAALARRFADTYRVAMLARNEQRLRSLEDDLAHSRGYICDVGDLKALEAVVKSVRTEMGPHSGDSAYTLLP